MNRDKNIDISDLFILRRIMQGLVTQLPDNVNTWRFVPKSYTFHLTLSVAPYLIISTIIH
jgi:hypothetical protein